MLNLTFAPSADILVPLAEAKIQKAWTDPFDPPTIIVPNPAVGKWLSIRLAESPTFGCVANARMPTLEKFLWKALEPDFGMELLDGGRMAQVVCAILDEEKLEENIYAPLKNYLCRSDGSGIDALKRVQLSARIAQQFLEYEYNRPSVWNEEENRWRRHGIDAKWLLGKNYFDGEGHEAWQMDLYRKVFNCFFDGKSARYTSLPHLYRRRRERAKGRQAWCDIGSNKNIILFGVSKISHFHRNTLVEISQMDGVEMHVFLTNPCAEFWEDVDTSRRRWSSDSSSDIAGIKPVKPDDYDKQELDMFANERDHTLLKRWGDAGKENIFLWCPQAQWNFEYHCNVDFDSDNASPSTLLGTIQKSLLKRNNDLDLTGISGNIADDNSIKILACPDISREVEETRELILDMVHKNEIDSFSDIAVYMPDSNKYLPHIRRVFGAYPQGHSEYIPFSILGASNGSSVAARAIFALLNIIGGNFNRAQIFELLRNPIVMASKKISSSKIAQWERWAEEHGMFRGFNAEQRGGMGDMGDAITNEHTFERGMKKVMAGIGHVDDDSTIVDSIAPANTDISYIKTSAETFLQSLRELNDLSAQFTKNNSTFDICKAVEIVKEAIWLWIEKNPSDGSVDGNAETRVKHETLDGLEAIKLQHTISGRTGISLDEFIALARSCVPEELSMPSSAWCGVTFTSLKTAMILPHRAIFVLGLGATDFPGTTEKSSWELLSHKRIVGDSDKVRDNRFAFLELLHAAKERLILSYRARDLQKDELLQPSSVISELEEYLLSQDRKKMLSGSIRREIPWIIHESLAAAQKAGRKHGTWDKAQRTLAAKAEMDRVTHRHDISHRDEKTFEVGNKSNTDLGDLKRFLENPLEYHLYRTLEIRDDDEGDMAAIHEPLESEKMFLSVLKKKIWIAVLNEVFSSESNGNHTIIGWAASEAGRIYDEHIDSGQAPEGHVCRMEKHELSEWAKKCAEETMKLKDDFSDHEFVEEKELAIECGSFTVNRYNTLILIPRKLEDTSLKIGILSFISEKKLSNINANPAGYLSLWLMGMTQWIDEIGNGGTRPISLVALNRNITPDTLQINMNMDCDKMKDIENWLNMVLSQMLDEKHCEHLPLKKIAEIIKPSKGEDTSFEKRLEKLTFSKLKNELSDGGYETFLKAFNLTDARVTKMNEDELRKSVKLRYAPILGGWIHEQ
ncbi:MAG: exodeoxyribonuclease V subunit gamma [Chitinispirillales bacterium]|jgi:exodeoxyribonuclease V gamma subunit|nr:exodeoxyribonuclease V subunit gamma [Chitinispirillales bacterium]